MSIGKFNCVVIGAGVVGIAIARELAQSGYEVILVEKENNFGTETSSRNSEVVHAGIYYPPGSLKALHCVEGRERLYDYCVTHEIPHKKLGKFIVAKDDADKKRLQHYYETARANGVKHLAWCTGTEVRAIEPELDVDMGLWSLDTGIIDSHSFMQSLLNDFVVSGGLFCPRTQVIEGRSMSSAIRLKLKDDEIYELDAEWVVNAAGLHASTVARSIEGIRQALVPDTSYAIGHYYLYNGKRPFNHLIYPVAQAGGLGIHVTLDLAGSVRFGPDVDWIDRIHYPFDDSAGRRETFVNAIRRYYPSLDETLMSPGYTGIRPKRGGRQAPNADFDFQFEEVHGVPGLVNLFGVESPGLTSALSIASQISKEVTRRPRLV